MINGKIAICNQIPKAKNILQQNHAKIFNKVCPAIIFANNRIDKLKTRAI